MLTILVIYFQFLLLKTCVNSKYMTYCLGCKRHTNNMDSRNVTMTKKYSDKNKGVVCVFLINEDF